MLQNERKCNFKKFIFKYFHPFNSWKLYKLLDYKLVCKIDLTLFMFMRNNQRNETL